MKSNNINWHFTWRSGMIAATIVILVYFSVHLIKWKMSGDSDKVTAEQFANLYIATPISKLQNLTGWGTSSYSEVNPTGYIYFDCDEEPVLVDANLYKAGGDPLALTDKFLRQFGKNAWSLLHTSDLTCLRLIESQAGPRRFLLHNTKTKRYFFARL